MCVSVKGSIGCRDGRGQHCMGWIPCRRLKTFYWRRALTQSTHRGITNMHSHTLSLSLLHMQTQSKTSLSLITLIFFLCFSLWCDYLLWKTDGEKTERWPKNKYFCSVWYVLLCFLCFLLHYILLNILFSKVIVESWITISITHVLICFLKCISSYLYILCLCHILYIRVTFC